MMKKTVLTVCILAMLTACAKSGVESGSMNNTASLTEELVNKAGDKVYFAFDRSSLSKEAKETLAKQIELMNKCDKVNFVIEGHADQRGTSEYNIALGERRANAVKSFLMSKGVASERLTIISYGKQKLSDTGTTEDAYSKNRRAVTIVE